MKMKSLIVVAMVMAALALGGIGALGQTIYKADELPMPTEYLSTGISDKQLVGPLRVAFPLASFGNRGLRLYLPDNFALVPVEDFKRLAEWYWGDTFPQSPEDAVIGLVGLASSLAPWSKIPIGFAVRGAPCIYVVFVTREAGQLTVYRLYWEGTRVVCQEITQPDCEVRLVVIF